MPIVELVIIAKTGNNFNVQKENDYQTTPYCHEGHQNIFVDKDISMCLWDVGLKKTKKQSIKLYTHHMIPNEKNIFTSTHIHINKAGSKYNKTLTVVRIWAKSVSFFRY